VSSKIDIFNLIYSQLEKRSKIPCYKQLYEILRKQILEGFLVTGTCLPSSRQLSQQLNISRNTAIAALNQLCVEGYAEAKPGSGFYIAANLPTKWRKSSSSSFSRTSFQLSHRGQLLYKDAPITSSHGAFIPGVPDLKLFPFTLWNRYVSRYARNPRLYWQSYPMEGGLKELRMIIAEHLRLFRGIQCTPNQVLITHGTQNSLNLIVSLLTDKQDVVWIENPGYPGARSAFLSGDLKIVGQPIDKDGIAPPPSAWEKPPRLIYVTPSHQYPLGAVMSASRRQEFINPSCHRPNLVC
jgi:GntR family transcriptional regulator/MocR family aminotransferase